MNKNEEKLGSEKLIASIPSQPNSPETQDLVEKFGKQLISELCTGTTMDLEDVLKLGTYIKDTCKRVSIIIKEKQITEAEKIKDKLIGELKMSEDFVRICELYGLGHHMGNLVSKTLNYSNIYGEERLVEKYVTLFRDPYLNFTYVINQGIEEFNFQDYLTYQNKLMRSNDRYKGYNKLIGKLVIPKTVKRISKRDDYGIKSSIFFLKSCFPNIKELLIPEELWNDIGNEQVYITDNEHGFGPNFKITTY